MWPSKLTDVQREQILEQYDNKVPVEIIAAKFKVHHSYPTLLARRRGKKTRAGMVNLRFVQPVTEEKQDGQSPADRS